MLGVVHRYRWRDGAVVRIVALDLLDLSAWSLHVLPVSALVLFDFLRQSEGMHKNECLLLSWDRIGRDSCNLQLVEL